MTVRDLLGRVNLNPLMRSAVRTTLNAFAPGALDAAIDLKIDRDAGRIRLDIGGQTVLEASFDAVESYVSNPST